MTCTAHRVEQWGARHLADHEAIADAGGTAKLRGKGVTSPGPLAGLMTLELTQIDADFVKAWLGKEAAKRATRADLAFRLFRAFVAWCETVPEYKAIVSPNAFDTRIAKDVLPRKSVKQDCLQREQLKAWFAAVRAIENPTVAAYLQILLLTGARRRSLADLRCCAGCLAGVAGQGVMLDELALSGVHGEGRMRYSQLSHRNIG